MTKSLGEKKIFWGIFIFVILIGFLLRLRLVFERSLWADEVFYFNAAASSSFKDIIFLNHPIRDNPSLFLLFLKVWSYVSKSIFWLRLPGILAFVISCLLLSRLFGKLDWTGRLIAIAFFVFSPFFVQLNFWVSPFNFVLILVLIQLNTVKDFIEAKPVTKKQPFILRFALLNFLLFNTHYSSIYVFFLYPPIYVFLALKNKKRAKIFLISTLVSAIFLIPTVGHIFKKWPAVSVLLKANPADVEIPSIVHLFLYIFDKSILRLDLTWLTLFVILIFLAFVLISFLTNTKNKNSQLWLNFFLGTFILPAVFLYLFYPNFPSIFVDRSFQIFHLGFYFLIAYILISSKAISNACYFIICFFLILLLASAQLGKLYQSPPRCLVAGDVTCEADLKQNLYVAFIKEITRNLADKDNWVLVAFGDNPRNHYQKFVFLAYYFPFSNELKETRSRYGNEIGFLDLDEASDLKQLAEEKSDRVLLLNFDRRYSKTSLEQVMAGYGKEAKVIDFWEHFQ